MSNSVNHQLKQRNRAKQKTREQRIQKGKALVKGTHAFARIHDTNFKPQLSQNRQEGRHPK